MADEQAPVESGHPEPFTPPEGHRLLKEDEWAELDNRSRQYDELTARNQRLQQVVAGNQREFGVIKETGFNSIEEASPWLKAAAAARNAGVNPDHFERAFAREAEVKPITLDAIREVVDHTFEDRLTKREQAAFEQRVKDATTRDWNRIRSIASELAGEGASDFDIEREQAFLERRYANGFPQGQEPGDLLDKIVAQVREMRAEAEAQAEGRALTKLADDADKPVSRVKSSGPGGMGTPGTNAARGGLSGDDELDDRVRQLAAGMMGL